jgi:hypothetical protein
MLVAFNAASHKAKLVITRNKFELGTNDNRLQNLWFVQQVFLPVLFHLTKVALDNKWPAIIHESLHLMGFSRTLPHWVHVEQQGMFLLTSATKRSFVIDSQSSTSFRVLR